jgi:alkylation response protein AidB-like acyl-CoA dehydrogenase
MDDSQAPDAEEVGALAAKIFADGCPPATVRELMGTEAGHDRAVWGRWARETGLPGLGVPEEYGGGGFGLDVLGRVFEAAGATLVCAPLLSTVGLAVPLLLAAEDPAAAERWLPGICQGTLTATVAITAEVTATVGDTRDGDGGWRLTGRVERVVDGATADLLLVVAVAPDGRGVFAVEPAASRGTLVRTPLMSLDLTRRQAAIELAGVPARRVGGPDDGWIEPALDVSRTLLAAELVGVAQHCLDVAVQYASQRIQFGRPIGSFQAVKQRAAELLVKVELARSAARHAAETLAEEPVAAAIAKAFCAEAAVAITADAIQLHGGIGFTWEHEVHLYYKRAITDDELLGAAATQWARVADHLDRAF